MIALSNRTVTDVTAMGNALWFILACRGEVGMSDVRTYESFETAVLIEERNEKPLRIALFAVVAAWTVAVLIALV